MDIAKYAQPKYLIVLGVTIVGGLFVASKMRPKETPVSTEPEPIVSVSPVTDINGETRADELSRSITELEAQRNELLDRIDQQESDFNNRYKSLEDTARSERDTFNARLLSEQQRLGNQFGAQIAALNEQIKKLKDELTKTPSNPPNNQNPANQPNKVPINTNTPQSNLVVYPGLPNGFAMNCGAAYKGLIGTFDYVVNTQKQKGLSSTSLARNMIAIAMWGTPTPLVNRGDWNNPAAINQRRVRFGLYPLTQNEINTMLAEHRAYPLPQGERTPEYQNLTMGRTLFERWNRPYQCGNSPARK